MSLESINVNRPQHFTIDLFEKALKQGLDDSSVHVLKVVVQAGTKPGENYCSTGYSVSVTFTCNNGANKGMANLFVKVIVISAAAEFLKEGNVFHREYQMYMNVLPKMHKLLDGELVAPKCFYYSVENDVYDTIIFENATNLGYTLADRIKGLDEDHCALVLRKLAKFHATSMVIAKQYPDVYEKFKNDVVAPNRKKSATLMQTLILTLNSFTNAISSWKGFEEISEKFEKFASDLKARNVKLHTADEASFKVLLHNDLWTNNILFKYENGAAKDVFLIDLQMCYYSSPGIDLTHFLYTSPQVHLLASKRDFMIQEYYYKTFESTLRNLGYESIPSLEQLYDEIAKSEINGFFMCILKLYVICIDPDRCQDSSFETLANSETGIEKREIGMSSERFIGISQYVLRRMEQIGILK